MDKYFKGNRTFYQSNQNKNNKENVIKNFIDKINNNINRDINYNKGICYNITEQCMNIKKIVSKNRNVF